MRNIFNVRDLQGKPLDLDNRARVIADFAGPLQYYLRTMGQLNPKVRARVQELEGGGDFSAASKLIVGSIVAEGVQVDQGYLSCFDWRPEAANKDAGGGLEVKDVTSGIEWAEYIAGQPIRVTGVSGVARTITWKLYAALHAFNEFDFKRGNYYSMQSEARMMGLAYWAAKAAYFYGLIEATTKTVAFKGTAADSTVVRDIYTIAYAIDNIIAWGKTKKLPISRKDMFVILAPDLNSVTARVNTALALQRGWANNLDQVALDYRARVVTSPSLTATAQYYVILPGWKLIAGDYLDMTIEPPSRDVRVAGVGIAVAGNAAYAGSVGDDNQIQKCSMS